MLRSGLSGGDICTRVGSRRGSVLVGVLWCLALLSVVVIGVLHTARMDLLVVKNYGDRIQAHYLAVAGIEKAKALLYQDARERSRSGRHHSGALYDAPEQFRDVAFGRGQFRVFRRGREDEGGGLLYGISDEESRLNVNVASAEELGKLYGMTPDVVAAILDWRDEDNTVTPGGAEMEYYASLQPPYQPRNGPLQTVRELLMVRGVSRELLLGSDATQNGLLATEGDDREEGSLDQSGYGLGRAADGGFFGQGHHCLRRRAGQYTVGGRTLPNGSPGDYVGHRPGDCRLSRPKPVQDRRGSPGCDGGAEPESAWPKARRRAKRPGPVSPASQCAIAE